MRVPGLGIDYPKFENLGLIPGQNQLDTPHNATGAIGWYHIYPKPGFKENAIFSAHVNYNGANGPFARLAQATANDQVVVVMENGLGIHVPGLCRPRVRDRFTVCHRQPAAH